MPRAGVDDHAPQRRDLPADDDLDLPLVRQEDPAPRHRDLAGPPGEDGCSSGRHSGDGEAAVGVGRDGGASSQRVRLASGRVATRPTKGVPSGNRMRPRSVSAAGARWITTTAGSPGRSTRNLAKPVAPSAARASASKRPVPSIVAEKRPSASVGAAARGGGAGRGAARAASASARGAAEARSSTRAAAGRPSRQTVPETVVGGVEAWSAGHLPCIDAPPQGWWPGRSCPRPPRPRRGGRLARIAGVEGEQHRRCGEGEGAERDEGGDESAARRGAGGHGHDAGPGKTRRLLGERPGAPEVRRDCRSSST